MSLDRSLKSASSLVRHRNVLTRTERLEKLKEEEKWTDAKSVFGLPKVAHRKMEIIKGAKDEAEGAETAVAGATPGAAGAAPAAAAAGKGAAAPAAGAKGAAGGKGGAPAAGKAAAAPAAKKK